MHLGQLFEDHREEMVRALARFSRDEAEAEDAVSQTFVKGLAMQTALEAMPERSARAWLYTTARNTLIDAKRKQRRIVGTLASDPGYWPQDPVDVLFIRSLMDTLPEHLRKVVEMRYFAQCNATQIGQALCLNPATVRTQLKTALALMRRQCKEDPR